MDQTFVMSIIQGVCDGRDDTYNIIFRKIFVVGGVPMHQSTKIFALDKFHRQVVALLPLAEMINRDDVRMVQISDCLSFALETLCIFRFAGQVGFDDLNSSTALKHHIHSFVDSCHAALPKEALYLIIVQTKTN